MRRSLLATTFGLLTIAASAGAAPMPARHAGLPDQSTTAAKTHDSTSTKTKKSKTKTPPAKDPTTTSSTSPATSTKPHKH